MTRNEFAILCEEFEVAPAIALEDDAIVEALKTKDDQAVRDALAENF